MNLKNSFEHVWLPFQRQSTNLRKPHMQNKTKMATSYDVFRNMLIPLNMIWYTSYRLQLKRGLFWYRHYPKLHQMVKHRSSRALVWTNLRQISLRVFLFWKNEGKMIIWSKQSQTCWFSWKNYMPHTKVGQKQMFRYNLLKIN